MSIIATCATILGILAAQPAEPVKLTGDCGSIEIKQSNIVLEAEGATVRGLRLTGNNIRVRGGTYHAKAGMDGTGPDGYAIYLRGDRNAVYSATITNAKKGAVVDQAKRATFSYNRFVGLREDGLIVSRTHGLTVTYNIFADFQPRPTQCTTASGAISYGLPKRDCDAFGGIWKDGNHADAAQLRNDVRDATIANNALTGEMQGIGQMDTTGDLPLQRVTIRGNVIQTRGRHPITLTACIGCAVNDNYVARAWGSDWRAVVIEGNARRCGNYVQDQPADQRC